MSPAATDPFVDLTKSTPSTSPLALRAEAFLVGIMPDKPNHKAGAPACNSGWLAAWPRARPEDRASTPA